jgi:hypothetical protein
MGTTDAKKDATDQLCYLPARVLSQRLRQRELSAVEVLDAYLRRIERLNATLNAVVSADFGQTRQAAAAAERLLARGQSPGPLHGVPMTVKDGYDVAGLRTTNGTTLFDRIAERDGTVAARLRAAGAIIFGHSNVPPLLADYRTDDPILGRTNNPWDLNRTPGGSSGGARGGADADRGRLGLRGLAALATPFQRRLRAHGHRAPRAAHRVLASAGRHPAVAPGPDVTRPDGARSGRSGTRPASDRRA